MNDHRIHPNTFTTGSVKLHVSAPVIGSCEHDFPVQCGCERMGGECDGLDGEDVGSIG